MQLLNLNFYESKVTIHKMNIKRGRSSSEEEVFQKRRKSNPAYLGIIVSVILLLSLEQTFWLQVLDRQPRREAPISTM